MYIVDAREIHRLLTNGIDLICLSDDLIVQNGITTIPTLVAKLDKLHKRRKFRWKVLQIILIVQLHR